MAQKVVVELVDDLDGTVSDDITTVRFGLDGANYEIDLSAANADSLRDAVSDFIAAARRTGGRVKRSANSVHSAPRPTANREQTKAVRDWARQNGFDLADRGRIPGNVLEAFEQAHAVKDKPKSKRSKAKAAAS